MVKVPAPDTEGLKIPFATPVPLYVPPEGEPAVSVTGAEVVQRLLIAAAETEGRAWTVAVRVSEAEHPLRSV